MQFLRISALFALALVVLASQATFASGGSNPKRKVDLNAIQWPKMKAQARHKCALFAPRDGKATDCFAGVEIAENSSMSAVSTLQENVRPDKKGKYEVEQSALCLLTASNKTSIENDCEANAACLEGTRYYLEELAKTGFTCPTRD